MKIVVYSVMEQEKPIYHVLAKEFDLEFVFCKQPPTRENVHLAQGAEAITCITTPITADLIETLHGAGVRYISTRSVGYDHIDTAKAKELGVGVGHSAYSPHNVAEYALMFILMATRKGGIVAEAFGRQDYSLPGKMGILLQQSTVGVVGTGKIGSTVIHMLAGFGCKILAYDPYPNSAVKGVATYVSQAELFAQSDIITLHTPATKENYHLINRSTIATMKDGVILVNTARGTLIDTDHLIKALQSGKVGFAALDVIEGETGIYYRDFTGKEVPHKGITTLSKFPNVLLTPHTAFFTKQATAETVRNAIEACVHELQGKENPFKIV